MIKNRDLKPFLGRKALVTGAGKRVGQHIALALAEAGCDLVVHYFNSKSGAEETVSKIKALGREVASVSVDLSTEDGPKELAKFVTDTYGQLDILINNASTFPNPEKYQADRNFHTETLEEWNTSFAINARAPFFLTQHLSSFLKKSKDGNIINILDLSVSEPFLTRPAYSVSKSALLAVTNLTARALARVVRIIDLELGAIIAGDDLSSVEIKKRRWGGLESVSESILYILNTKFLHGSVIRLDGGEGIKLNDR